MSPKIEATLSPEAQELVLLETLRALLTAAIQALSRGEAGSLAEVSRQVKRTAENIMATSLTLGHFPLTPEARQRRQKLLAELRQQRSFCRAMLRRWRRSILLRRQLLDLATEPTIYSESLDRSRSCHE